MADTIDGVVETLALLAETLDIDWADYGRPGADEYRVVIDSSIDYMKGLEGTVAMELPNVGVKVDRDEFGLYNVYLKVGTIEHDGES
jgi:hypothetical protein